MAAEVDEKIHKKLFRFGYYVGMSYQIMDDILDFTATEKDLGSLLAEIYGKGILHCLYLFAMEDPN